MLPHVRRVNRIYRVEKGGKPTLDAFKGYICDLCSTVIITNRVPRFCPTCQQVMK